MYTAIVITKEFVTFDCFNDHYDANLFIKASKLALGDKVVFAGITGKKSHGLDCIEDATRVDIPQAPSIPPTWFPYDFPQANTDMWVTETIRTESKN